MMFEYDIVRIEKEVDNEVFIYKCFDQDDKEVLVYRIDWDSYEFSCSKFKLIDKFSNRVFTSFSFSASNLYDKPNIEGSLMIDSKIHIIYD
jgi:hypothetical protein